MMLRWGLRSALDMYGETANKPVAPGPGCWHLVALADDKRRAEQPCRIRRTTRAEVDAGATPATG